MNKTVIAAALGECVHMAGKFLIQHGCAEGPTMWISLVSRTLCHRIMPARRNDMLLNPIKHGYFQFIDSMNVFHSGGESMIHRGSIIHCIDFWRRGRTGEHFGLEQWNVSKLTKLFKEAAID